jgi:pimeloyl-ACP methyl ester carboxylesterase
MRVHYKLIGDSGPALVLVHGWACNVGFWRGQAPLAKTLRLVLVDLPGHGLSDKPEIAYTMPLFARAVEAVLRDAKIEQAVLAGHSMGTAVVWQFSRLFPLRTRALVAVDGAFRSYVSSQQDREKFAERYRGPNFVAAMTAVIDGIAGKTPPPPLRDEIRSEMLKTPQHVVASAAYEMSDPEVFVPDPKVPVPVLAVYADSPFWSADYRTAISAFIPELEYKTIDGVGHFLMLEKPELVNELVLRFLRERGLLER